MIYHNQLVKGLLEKVEDEIFIWIIDGLLLIELENKDSSPNNESTQWQKWELEQKGL